MPFVKLDCGILNSTIWFEREAREVFITALLMAEPFELKEPTEQIETASLNSTGWTVPPGWYGLVPAAGKGIVNRAGIQDEKLGLAALDLLAKPEETSRSRVFEGRRMVRINGGFVILNYMKYRDRDYTAKDRQRRMRERRKALRRDVTSSRRDITHSREQKAESRDREQIAETHTPTNARALTTKPIINGADLRRHGQHRWCDHERDMCVPAVLHDGLMKRLQKSDGDLVAWYPTVIAAHSGRSLVGDVFKFWNAQADAWTGASLPATPRATKGQQSIDAMAQVLAERHGLRR